jgi:hypothetical protein
MKSRTKSTRENFTIDSKSRKISDEQKTHQKSQHNQQSDTRKYLLKTISILQQNIKIPKIDKKTQTSTLSANIYNIVKQHFAHQSKAKFQDYSSLAQIENHPN